jgi:hypothetical protein
MANNPISAPPSGNTTRSNAGQNRKNPFVSMDISGVEPTKVTVAKSLEEANEEMPAAEAYTNAEQATLDRGGELKGL